MNTKRSNLWDTEAHTHTHLQTLRMCCRTCACVSSCHWCSFKKKSTSLPRELSAIADLNPHRYLSAASSFWTAVAAVTKQVHFCFSGTNPRASAERPRTIWMHTAQGFYRNGTQVESPCQHSLTSESYYRTGGAGLIYDHSSREWLFFIPSLPCLWCCWVKILCRTLSFSRFSTINI